MARRPRKLPTPNPDWADRAEDRVDADGADDATNPYRSYGAENRVDVGSWIDVGHAAEGDRVPDPTDAAVGMV